MMTSIWLLSVLLLKASRRNYERFLKLLKVSRRTYERLLTVLMLLMLLKDRRTRTR